MKNNINKRLWAFVLVGVLLATMLVGGAVAVFSTLNRTSSNNPISGLSIATHQKELEKNKTLTLEAKATSVTGAERAVDHVDWKSLDAHIASIDENGTVTGLNSGVATLTATLDGKVAETTVRVWANDGLTTGGTIQGPSSIEVGATQQYTAVFDDYVGQPQPETFWSTDNVSVATVDEDGLVTGVAGGQVTITARVTNTNIVAQLTLMVAGQGEVTDIVMPSKIDLPLGATQQIVYSLLPAGVQADLQWSTMDKSIATVDSQGVITTKKEGQVTIKAQVGQVVAYTEVYITDVQVTKLEILGSATTTEYATTDLTVKATPANALQVADWTISGKSGIVKFVDADGNALTTTTNLAGVTVLGVKQGETEITVTRTVKGQTVSAKATFVVGARLDVTGVQIVEDDLVLAGGTQMQLHAEVTPASADQTVTWRSNDESIVDINRATGEIATNAKGTTTIYVRAVDRDNKPYEDSIKVTVTGQSVQDIVRIEIDGAAQRRVAVGNNLQLTATLYDANNQVVVAPGAVKWQSTESQRAFVNGDGKVSALAVGTAQIEARVAGNDSIPLATVQVEVIPTPDATNINIIGADVVPSGTVSSFTATTNPVGVEQSVVWTADALSQITGGVKVDVLGNENGTQSFRFTRRLDANDQFASVFTGKVIIRATHTNGDGSTVTTTKTITVSPNPIADQIDITGPSTLVGGEANLLAVSSVKSDAVLSEGVLQRFVWRSLNEDMVKLVINGQTITGQSDIQKDGKMTIRAGGITGQATIVAEVPGTTLRKEFVIDVQSVNSDVVSVSIVENGENVKVDKVQSATIYTAQKLELVATGFDNIKPTKGDVVNGATFHWWSSETQWVTVDQNGVVALVPGATFPAGTKATIYAEAIGGTVVGQFNLTLNTRHVFLQQFEDNYATVVAPAQGASKTEIGVYSTEVINGLITASVIERVLPADQINADKAFTTVKTQLVNQYQMASGSIYNPLIIAQYFTLGKNIDVIAQAIATQDQADIDAAKAIFDLTDINIINGLGEDFSIPYLAIRDLVNRI